MKDNMDNLNQRDLIQRFADGCLTGDEAKKAEILIKKSPEAKREYDEITAIGNAMRTAMQDEVSSVDFRGVWSYINEGIDAKTDRGFKGLIDYFLNSITPRKAVAAVAGALAVIAAVIIFYEISIAPVSVHASPTIVESIQYGINSDIVVAVDTLESATTVVYIEGLEINKSVNPPNEI